MAKPIECETERLWLRQWTLSDRKTFAALNADPKVMEYFPAPLDRVASDRLADRCQSRIEKRGWGLWAVETKMSHEFIGFVGLEEPAPELPCAPCVEVGWRLSASHWRNGFATEAARGALRVGFEIVGLDEIVSFTSMGNLRSRAVMKRLGMLEDTSAFQHPGVPVGSPLREHCLYRLSQARWAMSNR